MLFKLPGRPTLTFRMTRQYDAFPNAPKGHRCRCVVGISTDGKWKTVARVADVDLVADVVTA